MNGAGKTTLFEAVKLCLFGKDYNGQSLSKTQYEKFIQSCKNRVSTKNNEYEYYIQMKIQLEDVFPIYTIDLRREWFIEDGKFEEKFQIIRNGHPLEIIAQEYWEEYIRKMVPPYVSDYFFFDGERMRELTAGNAADSILRDSIRDILGLKLYETLNDDLSSLQSKLKRKNLNNDIIISKLKRLQVESIDLEDQIKNINDQVALESSKIQISSANVERIEGELHRKAGALAKKRNEIEEQILRKREAIASIDREIVKICNFVPFVTASDLCQKLVEQITKEKNFKDLTVKRTILNDVNSSLLERIDDEMDNVISPAQNEQLKSRIHHIFSELQKELEIDSNTLLIHDLTSSKTEYIMSFFSNIEEKGKKEFRVHLGEREKLKLQVKNLEKSLQSTSRDALINEHIDEITKEKSTIEVAETRIQIFETQLIPLKERQIAVKDEIGGLENTSICVQGDQRKIEVCSRVQNSVSEFIDVILASKTGELGNLITQMYLKLANKEDLVKKIIIEPETFSTILLNSEDTPISKDDLSAGEKEIYALSILWGLSKLSKSHLPVIVDSLLARLDTNHVGKIVENFLPSAGDQVIILSHDREVDERLYRKLLPFINKSYVISYDESAQQKIKRGYFFD